MTSFVNVAIIKLQVLEEENKSPDFASTITIALSRGVATHTRTTNLSIGRMIVYSETRLRPVDREFYNMPLRCFPIHSHRCVLAVVEYYTPAYELVSRVASYVFLASQSTQETTSNNSVEYGDNFLGEECYWEQQELDHHLVFLYS